MQQQITRGDYLKDLITIYIENNLQQELNQLYSQFVFQCGEIQKFLTPAQVIKISFTEQESQLLTNYNTCYLAGITTDGHKETFNGSLSFNTRGEVVYYEPTPNGSVSADTTSSDCPCTGLRGFFANCTQPAIKAYFSLNYVPTKLSELTNDTDFVDSVDVAESISEHNASESAHPYIQSVMADTTEALTVSIQAETTARIDAVSLAISTTEGYTDSVVSVATEATRAYADSITSAATTATEVYADASVSVHNTATNAHPYIQSVLQSATNNLQTQIDGLAAASDVTDIVGTYAELQAYDTQHLNNNDIIKVLSDETHDDEPSYYRFNKTAGTFSYIGSESAAYTKAQSNSIFVAQTTTVNNKPLSSDITLTYSDVDALSETYATVISENTSAISANTSAIAANTSVIAQHTSTLASHTSTLAEHTTAIATNTSDISGLKNLSNLTSNGEARLHALKAYADNGELLTDHDGLAYVNKYAHSTFDLSKFTVVGSPIVTEDGVYNGTNTNTSNYLSIANNKLGDFTNAGSFIIYSPIFTVPNAIVNSTRETLLRYGSSYDNYDIGLMITIYSNLKIACAITTHNGTNFGWDYSTNALLSGHKYQFKFEFTGTAYKCSYKDTSDTSWTEFFNHSSTDKIGSILYDMILGANVTTSTGKLWNQIWSSDLDLKQFSITVDGVEVFSGNRTGIDTIKSDDYTKVGTPTISADGVASGFSSSNYINTIQLSQLAGKSWTIKDSFTFDIVSGNACILGLAVTYAVRGAIYYNASGNVVFGAYCGTTGDTTSEGAKITLTSALTTVGAVYSYELSFDYPTGKYTLSIYNASGTLIDSDSYTATSTNKQLYDININPTTYITVGKPLSGTIAKTGSIDLNSFKNYVDGNLVYQPCLKIPYTESKTGSKIVDSIYRDRVADMSAQFGYAPYYTLSDTDFTLPQVELYGLIGQKTLRYSYENGINKVELYSNRDLTQQGSCTSGVEVTFMRPFADTNYILTVPYSAKSATAFTPTQTGDWKAEGKGWL